MSATEDITRYQRDALLAVLRVGADATRRKSITGRKGLLKAACRHVDDARLPLVDIPKIRVWHRVKLRSLKLPSAGSQLDEMVQLLRDDEPEHWATTGASLDVQDLDAFLVDHPNLGLRSSLQRIARSCFAPDQHADFAAYLKKRDGTPDRRRVLQMYVLFAYVTGSKDKAEKIATVLSVPQGLRAMRSHYQYDKSRYGQQRAAVRAFVTDLEEHRQDAGNTAFPNWKDYVDTKG